MVARHRISGKSCCAACAFSAVALWPVVASASPRVVYHLGMNGWLWGNNIASSFQFDQDQLSTLNLNFSGTGVRASAGDISAHWDELGFAGRGFRGLALGLPTGKVETTLVGGTIAVPDFEGRLQTSSLYGLRAALPLGKSWKLSAAQMWTPGAPLDQGAGINTLAVAYQPHQRQRIALELAHSHGGNGAQISWALQNHRLNLRTSYRQVASGFSTAGNPLLRTNRSGYFASARYKVTRPLTLSASSQQYADGIGGNSRSDAVSMQLAPRKLPSLTLFWQGSAGAPAGSLLLAPQKTRAASTTGLRLSHSFRSNFLSLGYEHLRFDAADEFASASYRLSMNLVRSLDRRTLLTAFFVQDKSVSGQEAGSARYFTDLSLHRNIGNRGLSVDLGLQVQSNRSATQSGQALGTRVGFRLPLKNGSSMGMDYRTQLAASGSRQVERQPSLYLSYSQGFQIGKRNRSALLPAEERKRLGGVSGRVFEDSNGNGQWEDGEPAVPDVTVAVGQNASAQSGQNGRYLIKNLRPGENRINLQMRTLPIEFTTLSPVAIAVQVPPGKTATIDFPVMRTGQIKGIVFRDENRNGVQDNEEAVVADSIVRLEGSEIISFTGPNGEFTLAGVPPRKWKVSLDASTLGEEYEVTGEGHAEVSVSPNGTVEGVQLGIAPVEREIISTFEKSL